MAWPINYQNYHAIPKSILPISTFWIWVVFYDFSFYGCFFFSRSKIMLQKVFELLRGKKQPKREHCVNLFCFNSWDRKLLCACHITCKYICCSWNVGKSTQGLKSQLEIEIECLTKNLVTIIQFFGHFCGNLTNPAFQPKRVKLMPEKQPKNKPGVQEPFFTSKW